MTLLVLSTTAGAYMPSANVHPVPSSRRRAAAPAAVMTPPSEDVWNDEIRLAWTKAYSSVPGEYDYEIDEIEGSIPSELKGTVWRNGPGNFDRGGKRYEHVLDGDGYLGRISIDGATGRASFKGRFVRTADFEAEVAAGKILTRNTFGTQPEGGVLANAGRLVLKNVANTNVITLGGRVLALWEAGMPQRVTPETMDYEGNDDLDGCLVDGGLTVSTGLEVVDRLLGLGQAFTAHPRVDPASNRVAGFCWASKFDQSAVLATVREWEQDSGQPVHATPVELAGRWAAPRRARTLRLPLALAPCACALRLRLASSLHLELPCARRAASRRTTSRSRPRGTSSLTTTWSLTSSPSPPASRGRSSACAPRAAA